MTLFDVLKKGTTELEKFGVTEFDFDAFCLLVKAFNLSKTEYYFNRFNLADTEKASEYFKLIQRRISGEPLQYIIGKWEFMDGEFYVGEGVLIPRQDTEILVETAAEYIKANREVKNVVDLCAGSGCVGISLAMMFPDIEVTSVELSDKAYSFLENNIDLNHVKNVKAINGDITKCFSDFDIGKIDVLVSNPPYIETDEIKVLSREVQREPHMALDGGKDGYYFYNVIKNKWLASLKKGSFAAFECGENQAFKLAEMFKPFSSDIKIFKDLNGIDRVVSLIKN